MPTIPFLEALRGRLPAELEPHLHKGATTQDLVDTVLVLQVADALALVAADLQHILRDLCALAVQHRATPCAGRSYGQQAAPVSFGFKAAIWAACIADVAQMLPQVRAAMHCVSLGGPVGTLAGIGAYGPRVLGGHQPRNWGWGHRMRQRGTSAAHAWRTSATSWRCSPARSPSWRRTWCFCLRPKWARWRKPHVPGRGGSSAMPHKRNPVSATVILAAHGAAPGLAATLTAAMAASGERPAGAWHAEWHALQQLFGLVSGALREGRRLAAGLEVDAVRMARNLDLTGGLLFADAVAARLAPRLGREAAHRVVESAADRVRRGEGALAAVLQAMPEVAGIENLDAAFDVGPSVAAAGLWTDRAVVEVLRVADVLAR